MVEAIFHDTDHRYDIYIVVNTIWDVLKYVFNYTKIINFIRVIIKLTVISYSFK